MGISTVIWTIYIRVTLIFPFIKTIFAHSKKYINSLNLYLYECHNLINDILFIHVKNLWCAKTPLASRKNAQIHRSLGITEIYTHEDRWRLGNGRFHVIVVPSIFHADASEYFAMLHAASPQQITPSPSPFDHQRRINGSDSIVRYTLLKLALSSPSSSLLYLIWALVPALFPLGERKYREWDWQTEGREREREGEGERGRRVFVKSQMASMPLGPHHQQPPPAAASQPSLLQAQAPINDQMKFVARRGSDVETDKVLPFKYSLSLYGRIVFFLFSLLSMYVSGF